MKVKSGSVKNGTGKKTIIYNMSERKVHIDYSGNEDHDDERIRCFRNDASVLFSLANSYWNATIAIEKKIEEGFNIEKLDIVESLIIPYLFNFRHFVELSIKALFMSVSGEQAQVMHDITKLFADLKPVLLELKRDERKGIFAISDEVYVDAKEKIVQSVEQIENILLPYFKNEPAVEYYRFLFDKDNRLEYPEIDFDFNVQKELQHDYYKSYKLLIREIHRIHYIYDMR